MCAELDGPSSQAAGPRAGGSQDPPAQLPETAFLSSRVRKCSGKIGVLIPTHAPAHTDTGMGTSVPGLFLWSVGKGMCPRRV